MKDPFPIPPPEALVRFVQPLAEKLSLHSLGLHAHEVLFAFFLYTFLCSVVSPRLSAAVCPQTYSKLSSHGKLNWDVHVVSFFQSVLISILSLYVMFYDQERKELRGRDKWEGRVCEYTGMNGLAQSFGMGYFLWDFFLCAWHVDIFGVGMLAHAISALAVFGLGYRPFIYFYAPVFLLYELSSPFLNIHWFCDKLGLTGSIYQAINGAFLVASFFGARLIFGNLSSFWVFYDVFHAVSQGRSGITHSRSGVPKSWTVPELMEIYHDEQMQRLAFKGYQDVPLWLALTYLASNLTLNSLNLFWFGKMIQTIRKRFDPPFGTKGIGADAIHYEPQEKIVTAAAGLVDANPPKQKESMNAAAPAVSPNPPEQEGDEKAAAPVANANPPKQKGSVRAARERAEAALNGAVDVDEGRQVQRVVLADGSKSIEISGQKTMRTRRKA